MKIDAADSLIAMAKDEMGINEEQPPVQVVPKFKYNIGDLVTYKSKIKKVISRELDCKGNATYVCSLINGQSPLVFNEIDLEPYTEQNKEPMEEVKDYPSYLDSPKTVVSNDLSLCELLKGCEREEFYLLDCGNATLDGVQTNNSRGDSITFLSLHSTNFDSGAIIINTNGKRTVHGSVILYPSRALYEKYPLDAYSAWMEWKESRKPKYILQAEIRLISLDGRDVDWEQIEIIGVPDIDLSQASEVVRDTLVKFHSKVAQSK